MFKNLVASFLLLIPTLTFADVFGPGCNIKWSYPSAEYPRITGFKLYNNTTSAVIATIPKATPSTTTPTNQSILCKDAGLTTGSNTIYIVAYSPDQVSAKSNTVTFDYNGTALVTPGTLSITATITIP